MVVLAVMKWDIYPDKVEAYLKWTAGAIKRTLAAPGVVEFRAYRGARIAAPSLWPYLGAMSIGAVFGLSIILVAVRKRKPATKFVEEARSPPSSFRSG